MGFGLGSLVSLATGNPAPALGEVLGGAISSGGGMMAGKGYAKDVGGFAEQAWQRSAPWGVSGAFGETQWDPATMQGTLELSPELQAHYERSLGRAGDTAGFISQFEADPFEAQRRLYEQQKGLFAPQQQREQLALENRMRAQGMLGGTGGQMRMGTLLEKQQMKDLARQVQSMDQAQQLIDTYRTREKGDISQAIGIGGLPLKYGELGVGAQQQSAQTARSNAKLLAEAAKVKRGSQAAFWGSLGSSVGGMDFSGLGKTFTADPTSVASAARGGFWDDDLGMFTHNPMPSTWSN